MSHLNCLFPLLNQFLKSVPNQCMLFWIKVLIWLFLVLNYELSAYSCLFEMCDGSGNVWLSLLTICLFCAFCQTAYCSKTAYLSPKVCFLIFIKFSILFFTFPKIFIFLFYCLLFISFYFLFIYFFHKP